MSGRLNLMQPYDAPQKRSNIPVWRTRLARQPQIVGIDALRLCAASLVMFYHFGFWNWTEGQTQLSNAFGAGPSIGQAFHFGWVGVEIFFVISGVVIAYSAQNAGALQFARSRLLRLAPGAWVCATISFAIFAVMLTKANTPLVVDYLCTLVFWPFRAIDAVYWTLGMEIAFYALVFLMIRAGRLARLEPVMIALGLIGGLFWITALTLTHVLEHSTGNLQLLHYLVVKAEGNRVLQLLLVQHGCLFGFGIVIQRASADGVTRGRVAALLALTGACLLEIAGQNSIIERASNVSLSPVPAMTVWLAAMGLLIGAIAWNDKLLFLLGRRAEIVRFGGKITYPLYLVHNTVVFGSVFVLGHFIGISSIVIGMFLAFVVAALIERFPERLVRRLLSSKLSIRPAASSPVESLSPSQS